MAEKTALPAEIAQTERIGLGDLIISGLIAVTTFGLLMLWEYPGLHPGVWSEAVVATGVRPAADVMPGYFTAVATLVYRFFGISGGNAVLRLLGHLSLAGLAVCVFASLREWLAFAMRMRPQLSRRRTFVMRLAALIGTAAFVASDPIWTAGQCLSETTILLVLTLGAVEFFFVFLRKGTIKYAYLCATLLGLLAAETPLGFFFPVLFIAINLFIVKVMPSLESPFFKPAVMEVGKWHMTFLFVAALVVGIALNSWSYLDHQGASAIGETAGSIPLAYLLGYWHRIANAGDFGAWLLWVAVCILPFVVTTIKFPASADEEQFLSYASGLIFFFCGLVSFAQAASLKSLWFWTYFPMGSQYLLSIGLFCCCSVVAGTITILGVDSLCRNHKRLARQFFGADDEDGNPVQEKMTVTLSRSTTLIRRVGIVVIPLFLLSLLVPGRLKTETREMLEILQDGISELVREAGDAKYLFTDGNLDTAIEMEAARQGKRICCLSLMGGANAMAVHLRTRGLEGDPEDMLSFRYDTGMGMRSWIRDKPARLAESAALMGFDLWKRDGKPLPPMGGLLSRPTGFASEEERLQGVTAAHALAQRVLNAYAKQGGIRVCTDEAIRSAFLRLQWRLARMCTYRSESDDMQGRAEEAIAEAELAKKLNDRNKVYRDLVAAMEKRNAMLMQRLTPREGLQLSLARADFTMGKLYAETILGADPENPDANFAMGMYYQGERQLSRAETYLKRCLIRKPSEPAIYNNLAMIQIELKKFEAARVNVEKALKLIPGSAAVLDTKKTLEAAIEKAKNPPAEKGRRPLGRAE